MSTIKVDNLHSRSASSITVESGITVTIPATSTLDTSAGTLTMADNTVTLAKMAGLARGKIIYGDASGDPAALAVGSANQVLKSNGTDVSWGADAGLSGWSEDGAYNNLLPASASAGIYLGVNSATAANLLDDYETGTWTCSFTNPGSVTGYYVKVGNLCHVSAKISTSGGASGTTFGGLPFTSAASDDYRSSGGVGYQNSTAGVWNPLTNSSNTTFGFFIADASQEMGSTGKTTYFSITYPTS